MVSSSLSIFVNGVYHKDSSLAIGGSPSGISQAGTRDRQTAGGSEGQLATKLKCRDLWGTGDTPIHLESTFWCTIDVRQVPCLLIC